MHTSADKTPAPRHQPVPDPLSAQQAGNEPSFQLEDNRPGTVAQRKLQDIANNSPQVKQAAEWQSIVRHHSEGNPPAIRKKENRTGLPDNLKSGIEQLSGYPMDDVQVHYNSHKPAQLQAHAYAQGTEIHLASGQEQHLAHEAWHVVQQKQGRVAPTMQLKEKTPINDDACLENEADIMGAKALQLPPAAVNREPFPAAVNGIPRVVHQRAESNGIVQRLKKGDFSALAGLGLDVGTWIEFSDKLQHVGLSGTTMILRLLEQRGLDDDTMHAMRLVRQHQLKLRGRPRRPDLVDHLFGPTKPSTTMTLANELFAEVTEEKKLVICDGILPPTVVHSASDLLVWLVSHPAGSAKTPRSFANSETMIQVLVLLEKARRVITPTEVWDAVRTVTRPPDVQEEDDEQEDDGHPVAASEAAPAEEVDWGAVDGAEEVDHGWKAGTWEAGKDQVGQPIEIPSEFKRKLPSAVYDEKLDALKQRLTGKKLVGVHATSMENLGSLMTEGVSDSKVDTGHGIGKGRGFYIIPTVRGIPDLTKAEKSAKFWDPSIVAVYLPTDCSRVVARDGQNVQTLEAANAGRKCYYEFGAEEIVIPPSLFSQIILVRNPDDITQADPSLPFSTTKGSAVLFLNDL